MIDDISPPGSYADKFKDAATYGEDDCDVDLRPWGYAPGFYWSRCVDCPPDMLWHDRPSADKRAWRCRPHAEAAKLASAHIEQPRCYRDRQARTKLIAATNEIRAKYGMPEWKP